MNSTITKIFSLYSGLSIASGLILAPILGQMSSSIIPILFNTKFIEDMENKSPCEIRFTFGNRDIQPIHYLYGFLWGTMMPSYMIFNHLTNVPLTSIIFKINCNQKACDQPCICFISKNGYKFVNCDSIIDKDIDIRVSDSGVLTDETIGNDGVGYG